MTVTEEAAYDRVDRVLYIYASQAGIQSHYLHELIHYLPNVMVMIQTAHRGTQGCGRGSGP